MKCTCAGIFHGKNVPPFLINWMTIFLLLDDLCLKLVFQKFPFSTRLKVSFTRFRIILDVLPRGNEIRLIGIKYSTKNYKSQQRCIIILMACVIICQDTWWIETTFKIHQFQRQISCKVCVLFEKEKKLTSINDYYCY